MDWLCGCGCGWDERGALMLILVGRVEEEVVREVDELWLWGRVVVPPTA